MLDVIMLTCNRISVTVRCLDSLEPMLQRPGVNWYVVDNGSSDKTPALLRRFQDQYPEQVNISLMGHNLGVAGGRQYGLDLSRKTNADLILFLDNDVYSSGLVWLDILLSVMTNEKIGAAGPGGHFVKPGWSWYEPAKEAGPVDTIAGYCQMIRRKALKGFSFDMAFNPYWHEDTDTCLYIRSQGYDILYTGPIGLQHYHAGTNAGKDGKQKQAYLAQKWAGRGLVKHEQG